MRVFFFSTLASFFSIHPSISKAHEPDDFHGRADKNAVVQNATINAVLNRLMNKAIDTHNQAVDENHAKDRNLPRACSRSQILSSMKRYFDHNFPAVLAPLASEVVPAGPRNFADSNGRRSFIVAHPAMWIETYRVKSKRGEHMLGLDKIDHFFSHGYLYWLMVDGGAKSRDENLMDAMKTGVKQEQSSWGLNATNVKSYADLSANYHGLAFWQNLLDGPSPLFVCRDGHYAMARPFDLMSLIDESLDETLNCSSYGTKRSRDGLVAYGRKFAVTCPVDKNICRRLMSEYPTSIAQLILHPLCRGEAHRQIETPDPMTARTLLDMTSALFSGGTNLFEFWFSDSPLAKPAKADGISQ